MMFKAVLACLLAAFTTMAAAAPPVLAPSRFGDTAEVDSGAIGTRTPVILVHGLGGGNDGWENFLRAYAQNPSWRAAFKPYSFKYSTSVSEVLADPSAPRSITALGAALRDAMQSFYDAPTVPPFQGFGQKRVVVLAHSMGGLVARSMMQEHVFADGQRGGQKVLHLITLSTPHHGSPLANAGVSAGLLALSEISDTWPGFIAALAWTNYDGLDMDGGTCNPWLARMNNYAPSTGASHGSCGFVAGNALPGFYEKIIAYGTHDLQSPDLPLGFGIFRPGSSAALVVPYAYLRSGLSRGYGNDGIVPLASAQFDGAPIWRRAEAYACDHRFIRRGYQQDVKSLKTSFTEWAFCSASNAQAAYTSGSASGYALSGSIFGVPGGIVDTIKTVSQVERALDWAEHAFAGSLQPAGAATGVADGFYYRYYAATNSYAGVKDGNVYYLGPLSNWQLYFVSSLSGFFAQAQAAGF